jgi:hypothetical protein
MTVVSVGASATGGVPSSKSSTLLPGSGGTNHHRQYATLPRKMNASSTGTIGKFRLSAKLTTYRFPVHLEMPHTLFKVLYSSPSGGGFVSQFVVFHLYPVLTVSLVSQAMVFHLYSVVPIQYFSFLFGFARKLAVFHLNWFFCNRHPSCTIWIHIMTVNFNNLEI